MSNIEPDTARRGKTLIEDVYNSLKEEILFSRLEPGSKLRVEELRERFDVSASTVREALLGLVSDRLATAEGQRGFRVAPMSFDDLAEITSLRKVVECLALREAIARGDAAWEAKIVAEYYLLSRFDPEQTDDKMSLVRLYAKRNDAFHEALVAACTSRWLRYFRDILFQASERYRAAYGLSLKPRAASKTEHKAMMKAALDRDADLACAILEEHIDASFRAIGREIEPLRKPARSPSRKVAKAG